MKREEFYRLSLEGEEFFDDDRYDSVLEAFEDIPSRTREYLALGNNFKPQRVQGKTYLKYWKIEYVVENENYDGVLDLDGYYYKRVLRINAQKLLWTPQR